MSEKEEATDSVTKISDLQRRLDDITRLVSDWVWETDENLRLTYVSHRIFELLGLHPFQVEGQTFAELGGFTAWDGSNSEPRWRSPFRDVEFSTKDRGGQDRFFLISGLPVYDSKTGAFCGVRGTAEDITERRRVENDLKRSYEELEARVEGRTQELSLEIQERKKIEMALRQSEAQAQHDSAAKTQVLRNVSHELRTALNVIAGFSESMQSELYGPLQNERYQEYANGIYASGKRLLDMIGGFADLTALGGGILELREEAFDLSLLAADVIGELAGRAEENAIEIRLGDMTGLPSLYLDKGRLEQMLISILLHAIRRASPGARIAIIAENREDGVAVTVENTAMVLREAEMRIALEEPFSPAQSWLYRTEVSTGLDLFMVRQLAQAMGGELSLTSSEESGSAFILFFPKEKISG